MNLIWKTKPNQSISQSVFCTRIPLPFLFFQKFLKCLISFLTSKMDRNISKLQSCFSNVWSNSILVFHPGTHEGKATKRATGDRREIGRGRKRRWRGREQVAKLVLQDMQTYVPPGKISSDFGCFKTKKVKRRTSSFFLLSLTFCRIIFVLLFFNPFLFLVLWWLFFLLLSIFTFKWTVTNMWHFFSVVGGTQSVRDA